MIQALSNAMIRQITFRLFVLGAAALLGGCQKDDIESYTVPKALTADLGLPTERPKLRMLAALIPQGQHTWFFKLQAPEDDVAAHQQEFDRLLQSIRFADRADGPITWTTPPGWRREAGNQMRYATLRPESNEHPVELTVTDLPGDASNVLANVNRWRDRLSLPPVTEADLPSVTKGFTVNGCSATLVDFTGYGKAGSTMAPFAGHPPIAPSRPTASGMGKPRLTYTTPEKWFPLPDDASGIRLVGFQVTAGDQSIQITVTPLSAQSGSLLANVNRWRGQIGLPEIGEAELQRDLQETEVADKRCPYVDLIGPESAVPKRERLVAVVAEHGERIWYFKMVGNPELVEQQKSSFQAFLRSIRFEGGDS
jgi:hypothetical protein